MKRVDEKETERGKKTGYVVRGDSFIFPKACPCCMNESETTIKIKSSQSFGNQETTHHLKVPICKKCKRHIINWILFRWANIIIFILAFLFYQVGAYELLGGWAHNINILIMLAIFLVLIYLISRKLWIRLHPYHFSPDKKPVRMYASSYFNLTSVKFWFGNDKYLKLFANLNKGKYEEDKKIGIQL